MDNQRIFEILLVTSVLFLLIGGGYLKKKLGNIFILIAGFLFFVGIPALILWSRYQS